MTSTQMSKISCGWVVKAIFLPTTGSSKDEYLSLDTVKHWKCILGLLFWLYSGNQTVDLKLLSVGPA